MKSNIGHLEGASALAGIIKAVLVLEKGVIPPNANFEKLNPKINDKSLGLKVSRSCGLWSATSRFWSPGYVVLRVIHVLTEIRLPTVPREMLRLADIRIEEGFGQLVRVWRV